MRPEFQILILNAACLAIAYLGIYPSLRDQGLGRLAIADAVVTAAAIGTAGALFAGSGQRFDMILFTGNWLTFALVSYGLMSAPLAAWFLRRHATDMTGGRP